MSSINVDDICRADLQSAFNANEREIKELEKKLEIAKTTNKEFQDIIRAKDKWINKLLEVCENIGEEALTAEVRDALNYPDIEEAEMSEGWDVL